MTIEELKRSLTAATQPPGLSPALQALWHEARGNWEEAHSLIQNESDSSAAWVHAYLHRREGDSSNARYWYSRAGRSVSDTDLDKEWEAIVRTLLAVHGV